MGLSTTLTGTKSSKHIALITSYYEERGYGGNEYYLAKYLISRGHKVTIYVSEYSIHRYGNFRKVSTGCSLPGVKVVRLPSITYDAKRGLLWLQGLGKKLEQDKVDMIHVQEWFLPCVYPCLGKKPLLLTQRIADYPLRLKLFSKVFGKRILKHASHINSLTSTGKKNMVKYCGIPASKIAVISNGVNVDLFKPAPHAIKKEKNETIFVYVGRVDSEKGVDIIIEACEHLTFPYKVYVIGLGHWFNKMRALVKKKGLGDTITFFGKVDHIDLPRYYSSADCCLIPSKIEPFGFVTLEALACGSPVIGSDLGGMKDVITPDVGLKVPVSDPAALAIAMTKMNNKAFRKKLKKNCRPYILKNYSWEAVIKKNPFYNAIW
jgi:glycosyltransferase involved in cell wall biosynthesis